MVSCKNLRGGKRPADFFYPPKSGYYWKILKNNGILKILFLNSNGEI